MKNKIIYGFLALFIFSLLSTSSVSAENTEKAEKENKSATSTENITVTVDLQAIIEQLQNQIKELRNQLDKMKSEIAEVKEELKLTKDLHKGLSDEEVKELQKFLSQFYEIYPEGLITGYFGPLTEKAIKKFQKQHGIPSTGLVGSLTREKINESLAKEEKEEKVTICHAPFGNAQNKQTITIGKSAFSAHVAHGDVIGICADEPISTLVPTSVNLAWWKTSGEKDGVRDIGQYQQAVHFSYGGDMSTLQSFKVYLKRPGESVFTAIATFSNPASLVVTSGCSNQINYGTWSIHYCVVKPNNHPPYPWQVLGSVAYASNYPVGEYNAYVTTVNTAGVEGPASKVANTIVAKATLLSPIGVQGSLTPTFRWTVPSGLPPLNYNAFSYGGPGVLWSGFVGASAGVTDMSVTYDGPALDPSKTYTAHVYGEKNGYIVMGDSSPTFTVSQ